MPFVTGNRFRVNANQRLIDVWLIWMCEECGSTWNCTIHSRQRVNRIGGELYERFSRNDEELARRYAFDARLLAANGAEPAAIEYRVEGEEVTAAPDAAEVTVLLTPEFPSSVRLSALLAAKLGVSRRRLEALVEAGTVGFAGDEGTGLSSKLTRDLWVTIRPAELGEPNPAPS